MNLEKLRGIFQIQPNNGQTLVKKFSYIGMALSILGIADGTYLSISHFAKIVLACPETTFINCAKVTTSSYSEILGIPVAFLGLLFFLAMFVLQLPFFWRSMANWFRYIRVAFATTGIIFVFWLVYVELHILHSICLYCTAVHILTFALFINTIVGTALITSAQHPSPKL